MREGLRARPLAVGAISLVALEAGIAALGGSFPFLSLAVLLLAPGLALAPLLPARTRDHPVAALAALPALGFAASSVALVSLAAVGIPLTGTSIRVTLAGIAVLGLAALPGYEPLPTAGRGQRGLSREARLGALGLGLALLAGILLERRVIGGSPLPGNDWAKYVLYADEIRRQHSLLIDNPFWMLGVPFREEPGVPSVTGAYLELSGQPAAVVAHAIWVFSLVQILVVYALVRTYWSELSAVLAAALYAVLPINLTILGWHGLANMAGLALLGLVLLYAVVLVRGELPRLPAVGFGLSLVGLAAAHRLSFVFGLAAVGLAVLIGLVGRDRPRGLLPGTLWAVLAAAVLAPAVAYDLIERNRSFGGTLPYSAYLESKLDFGLLLRDLTIPFAVLAVAAVALTARWALRERSLWPLLATLLVAIALTYSWIVHLPLVYLRMAYFLPLALVPLAAIAAGRVLRPRHALAVGFAVVAVAGAVAWVQGPRVREFYEFASPSSLQGLDAVAAQTRPGEVIVTDRCWSFLGTWLVHTRTLAALETIDIQPKAELPRAREARAILDGTPAGRRLARRLGVRFLLVDPTCRDADGNPARPPALGRPLFVSKRLVVLTLPPT